MSCEAVDFEMTVGAGEDPIGDAVSYFGRIGPAARALADMAESERVAFDGKVREMLAARLTGGEVRAGAAAWIVFAEKKD